MHYDFIIVKVLRGPDSVSWNRTLSRKDRGVKIVEFSISEMHVPLTPAPSLPGEREQGVIFKIITWKLKTKSLLSSLC